MTTLHIPRPRPDEHAEFYAGYVARVPDGDLIALLRDQGMETVGLLQGLTPAQGDLAYAPGKWTIKQVVGHLIDSERIFGYRALCISRNERGELPPFDENAYVKEANFPQRTLGSLLEELQVVRASTIQFAGSLTEEMLARRGTASKHEISVRALLYIIAGHERHHVAILRERYLTR